MGGCRSAQTTPPPLAENTPAATSSENLLALPNHDEHRGQLRLYFGQKYSPTEVQAVRQVVNSTLSEYPARDQDQAVAEILAFSDVVYRITKTHRLENNHNAIRRYQDVLKKYCDLYQVPYWPVLAITSWENSGDVGKVSWADAAGLGQMTPGAIDQAHNFALELAHRPGVDSARAAELEKVARRHAYMAKRAHVADERFMPECNVEDVVLFYKFLYEKYGERADHAIGAYHKGLANHDDIIKDFLVRKEGSCPDPLRDRLGFIAAMRRQNVTYITLWNDQRCREMLNGLRTLDGDPTTPYNSSQALGDESDIYPWKVLGSLSGYLQGEQYVASQQQKFSAPQAESEVHGIPKYTEPSQIKNALEVGKLVRLKLPIEDRGVTYNVSDAHRELAYAVTPELEGYLYQLTKRWRERTGKQDVKLPIRRLLAVGDLAAGSEDLIDAVQLRGVTVQLDLSELEKEHRLALENEIKEDYLMDRIYEKSLKNDRLLLCLNPRFGFEFLDSRTDLQHSQENPPAHATTNATPVGSASSASASNSTSSTPSATPATDVSPSSGNDFHSTSEGSTGERHKPDEL